MWLRPLLGLFLLAAGLGFFVVLSFLLHAMHGKTERVVTVKKRLSLQIELHY